MSRLHLRNRQRVVPLNGRFLRTLAGAALAQREFAPHSWAALSIHLVGDRRMRTLNARHLNHPGLTDVITLDYGPLPTLGPQPDARCGDIFISVPEALRQARAFRTSWQAEVVRYLIHGLLHLVGYDDTTPPARRRMKRAENRLLRRLAARFDFARLADQPSARV